MPGSLPPVAPGIAHLAATEGTRRLGPVLDPEEPTCSARGCSQPATVAVRWNNPKIHPPERRKTWLACDEHEVSLTDFLAARGFLREAERL